MHKQTKVVVVTRTQHTHSHPCPPKHTHTHTHTHEARTHTQTHTHITKSLIPLQFISEGSHGLCYDWYSNKTSKMPRP